MKRIFYSDYGADPKRLARMEAVFKDLKSRGAEVCRTCSKPVTSVAKTLIMPNLAPPDTPKGGNDPLLRTCAAIFRSDRPRHSASESYHCMANYRDYIETELQKFSPDLVVLWHQFNAYHYVIANWCKQHNVPVIYGEHGVLPGSWCFEFGGQMAESWISRDPETFKNLPITKQDRSQALRYLQAATQQRMNRKTDGVSLNETPLAKVLNTDPRPKILYAGINDYKTGLQPFSRTRSLRHSGDFMNTELGLKELLRIAKRNNWLVLYKPHPSIKSDPELTEQAGDSVTLVDKNINIVDLLPHCNALATIVSQSAYMALFHGLPVVLMGRMQLSGSGLVYEAPYRKDLEHALHAALKNDHKAERADLLRDHVARLLKYYVLSSEYGERGLFRYDLSQMPPALFDSCGQRTPQPA